MTAALVIVAAIAAIAIIFSIHTTLKSARTIKRFQEEMSEQTARHTTQLEHARDERDRMLDALGDAFFIIDGDWVIRFANQAAISLFDGRIQCGRPVLEAILDSSISKAISRCLNTGEPVQTRIVNSQQTSPRGDLETRGQNAWTVDVAKLESSVDIRVIIRDVTAEHQVEQIRKDFVANASHELRTPLAIISGYLENLIEDNLVEQSALARRFLLIMRKHTERITRIVEDMLVISRLESGEAGALNIEPFLFRACINDILERLESLIRQNESEIDVYLPDPEIRIEGDRFYWTQVLFNLVENALKQNPLPGIRIQVGCQQVGDQIQIWVKDNGVGIPSADLPHIFRRFYRVEKHHSSNEIKGTGLGLSIVKRAIEAHHGTIGVTSVPGIETKFLMTIPASG
ncbi:hypothetical protein JIN85_00685 [Luteolibacter pohnpeiensis]|uniref:histidine kinase n=1 Tax=Luteolibacter pohnpeiensis TaxID=454153 RepID=A0A934S535_9BACT|nr:ATP-binding protein [Luteolibacter pohnpeiensis]MBK1880906.1 hypothetical protein [Luteolibacter pohnpeiensis]